MGTRTVSQPPALISSPTHVWTPSDVFLDSPVWRANIIHLEEQIDHFERWVEGFTKSLKQFIDVVKSKLYRSIAFITVAKKKKPSLLFFHFCRIQCTTQQFVQEDIATQFGWVTDR